MIYKDNVEVITVEDKAVQSITLPENKALALELLSNNTPVVEVAKRCGVSRTTIYHWMTQEPFKSALDDSRKLIVDELGYLVKERLTEMLCSENIYVTQYAISMWTKLSNKLEVNVKTEQSAPSSLDELLLEFNRK